MLDICKGGSLDVGVGCAGIKESKDGCALAGVVFDTDRCLCGDAASMLNGSNVVNNGNQFVDSGDSLVVGAFAGRA